MTVTESVYVCVKGSLNGTDCAAFGLTHKEIEALQSRFPNQNNTHIQVVNGILLQAYPLSVINALSELGYEVVASSGNEGETTWTMRREVVVDFTMHPHQHNHDSTDTCCQGASASGVTQTLSEMDFERGLWSAALFNEYDRVTKLLDEGADPNGQDNAGYTALHYAARGNNKPISQLLISRGANVNAITKAGQATPLHRAATAGHDEIVKLLLQHGADPYLKDSDGLTAFDRAKKDNQETVITILTEYFTNLPTTSSNNN